MAAPYNPPVKGEDFVLRVSLSDMAMPGTFKANPSLAAGDFKVDKDGYGLAPLAVMPVVQPAGSVLVVVTLTPAEMAADVVTIVGIDQSFPKEWADFVLSIPTSAMASTVHVASAIYLNDEMALQPPFADSAIGGGTIQALPPTAGAASAVARDGTPRAPGTIAPIHMVSGGEMDAGGFSLRMTNIGGGFSAGAVDSNIVSVWLDDNWVNSEAEPAPLDASVPSLILQPEWFVEIAKWHTFYNDFKEFDRYLEMGWWDKTALTMTVGFYSNYETGEPGAQPDMVFASMAANRDPAPQWKFAFSNGNHFVPAGDNVVDIGDEAHRVRDIHAGTAVNTPLVKLKQDGLLDSGSVVSERIDRPDIPAAAVLSNTDMTFEDFGYPDMRFRTVNIGTTDPWMLGEEAPVDTNGIYFYASDNYGATTPPDPTHSNMVAYLYPYTQGYAGIFGLYACEAAFFDYTNNWDATIGWDNQEAPTSFNIRVGFWSGSATASQVDLAFCADDKQPKWTMAFSNGNHLLPGTDNLQDIGSPEKRVRAVHAGSLGVENFTSDKVVLPPPAGYESVGSETLYNAFGYVGFINPNYTSGLWLDGKGNNLDDMTLPGEAMIISGGPNGWLVGAQAWGQGAEAGKPLYITANWGFGAWHEPHITPWRDNVSDIGSPEKRVRSVYAARDVSASRLLLADTGGVVGEGVPGEANDVWRGGTIQVEVAPEGTPEIWGGNAPVTLMSGGVVVNGTEGYRWRQMSIGGGGARTDVLGGSEEQDAGLDVNTLVFYFDADSSDKSKPHGGEAYCMMSAGYVNYFDMLLQFSSGDSTSVNDWAGIGWAADKTHFSIDIDLFSGEPPRDLSFSLDHVPKWRVAHSQGSHLLPETDDTLDIGSPEKRVRRVNAASLMGDVKFRDDTNGAPHWGIDHTNGSHLVPENSDTYDIGTEVSRVRNVYTSQKVSTPDLLLEAKPGAGGVTTGCSIHAKGVDQEKDTTLLHYTNWDSDAEFMNYRQLNIGGGDANGMPLNYISFQLSTDFLEPDADNYGKTILAMQPGGAGVNGYVSAYQAFFSIYNSYDVLTNYYRMGFNTVDNPTRFDFEVGVQTGSNQPDLAFCSDGPTPRWRMAFSAGNHLLPEIQGTQDIGSDTYFLRKLFTQGVHMPLDGGAAKTDGDIWFDGAALMMQVGGVPKAFAFAP